jgi:histidine triad (HIT) family protein
MDDCIFCKIVKGENSEDRIAESENFIAVRDIHPKTEGHSLVIPKEHFDDLLSIKEELGRELLSFIKEVAGKSVKEGGGFNLLVNNGRVAGQVVGHLHFHIIPRKEGDGLSVL